MTMNIVLMPKATAKWLVMYTSLTFDQIASFCDMHILEIKGIADGEICVDMEPINPIRNFQLTQEEIKLCEQDPSRKLCLNAPPREFIKSRASTTGYLTLQQKKKRYDAILWLIQSTNLDNRSIRKLIGATDGTIEKIRTKAYWNYQNLKPRDPVGIGLCTQSQLNDMVRTQTEKDVALERK